MIRMFTRRLAELSLLIAVAMASMGMLTADAEEGGPRQGEVMVSEQVGELVPKTLSLARAIEIAIEHNPQVAAAQQGVRATEGLLTQAKSALLPRLEVTSSRATPVDLPAFSFQSRDSTWETDFSFSQPLYTAGSIQKGVAAAKNYLQGAEGAFRRARQQIAFAVRQSYYGVLTAEEGVKVAQEVLSSAQEHLRIAQLRYQAGVAPRFDALAAEARVARVEQGLIAAKAGRDIAWAALSAVLGVPIPQGVELTTPRPVTPEEVDLDSLRQEALRNRPDLLAGQAETAAAWAQLAIARAARWPTVVAAASYGLRPRTTVSGEWFGMPGTEIVISQSSGTIALVASWSLFNGGQVEGEIYTADAKLKQAEKNVESLQQQMNLEVKRAYLLLEAAKAQVAAAQKEVAQAQEAHRIATLRYEEGVGTSVEILDAEANLEGAKTRLNQAVYGLNLAVAELELAVGRDWAESTGEDVGEEGRQVGSD